MQRRRALGPLGVALLSISLMSARPGLCTWRHAAGKTEQSSTADDPQLKRSDSPNDEQIVLEARQHQQLPQTAHTLSPANFSSPTPYGLYQTLMTLGKSAALIKSGHWPRRRLWVSRRGYDAYDAPHAQSSALDM